MGQELSSKLWSTIGQKIIEEEKIDGRTEVCVVRSPQADSIVSEIVATAARERGAQVTVHEYPPFEEWRKSFELPPALDEAVKNCDVLISHPYLSAAQFQWSKSVFSALIDYNVSHISLSASAEVLAGPMMEWPHELALTVAGKVSDMMFAEERTIRVTDDRGTDVTFTGRQELTHPLWYSGLREKQDQLGYDEGEWGDTLTFYPTGEVGWHPDDSAEGTFFIDALDGYGVLDEPMKWTIDEGLITDITGQYAEHFKAKLDEYHGEGANHHVVEGSFGFNPKCKWDETRRGLAGLLPVPGTFHFATGMATSKIVHPDAAATHVDALNQSPTVTVDNEVIMDDGELHLLNQIREDEEVREVAARYGNPDALLSPGVTDW